MILTTFPSAPREDSAGLFVFTAVRFPDIFLLSSVDYGSSTISYRSCALALDCLHSPPSRFIEHQSEMNSEEHHDAELYPMGRLNNTGVLVKPKWRGTIQDKMDMKTLGRNQVVRV
jgi:hypothetical protein